MNILVTGAWQEGSYYLERIKELGHKVTFMQCEKDTLPCDYEWVEGIIGNGLFLSHPIEKFCNLKYIQLTSAGYDRVPLDYINSNNIIIHNARGVYSIPMAEYAIWGVLSLYKKHDFFLENKKQCKWEKNRELLELFGKTVCILGCGSVGTECAKRFKAFGCDVYGIDIYQRIQEFFLNVFSFDNLYVMVEKADIVIITLPLTDETYHLFDKNLFRVMKKKSILVNIARGALVDTDALIEALDGQIGGAVLDVFEEEPLPESSIIWNYDNIIISPHNSFVGEHNNVRLSSIIINNLENSDNENIGNIT